MKTAISVILLVLLVIAMWLAIIISLTSRGPHIVDCGMASFHPDYTAEMRKACNSRFIKQ
jgi:hypothetical protein